MDKLTSLLRNKNGTYFDDEDYKQTLVDHIPYLVSRAIKVLQVEPVIGIRYRGDYYGLLTLMGVAEELQWLVMRMNGYLCSSDYRGELVNIIVPNEDDLSYIYTQYNTRLN